MLSGWKCQCCEGLGALLNVGTGCTPRADDGGGAADTRNNERCSERRGWCEQEAASYYSWELGGAWNQGVELMVDGTCSHGQSHRRRAYHMAVNLPHDVSAPLAFSTGYWYAAEGRALRW